jgi:hypothetical protein
MEVLTAHECIVQGAHIPQSRCFQFCPHHADKSSLAGQVIKVES